MSTKNIARTAIEGGRVKSNKYDRRNSNRVERHMASQTLQHFMNACSEADELDFQPRTPVMKEFDDKLAPAYRWLAKKALGMTADDIRGLLLRTFDTRSLAGRHLVFDHLMPRRTYNDSTRWSAPIYLGYARYDFDENDVLRNMGRRSAQKKAPKKLRIRAVQWIKTITEDQKIGENDGRLCVFKKNADLFGPVFVPVRTLDDREVTFWSALSDPERWPLTFPRT